MLFGVGSPCVDFAKAYLWSSYFRELFEKELGLSKECSRKLWEAIQDKVVKSVTTIDHRMFISQDKDQFTKEVAKLVNDDNTKREVLDIIGVMNAQYHNLYYFLKTGNMLPNIIFSTHVWKVADYQDVDTEDKGMIANLVGFLSHPETWVGSYMQNAVNYPPELLEYFDGAISRGCVELAKYVLETVRESLVTTKSSGGELDEKDLKLVKDIQDAVESSGEDLVKDIDELIKKISSGDPIIGTSARRFGLGNLTPEEREALRVLLLEIRVEAGITCGSMRTLVKAIMLGLLKRKDIDTEEEALEELPGILKKLITWYYKEGDLEEELSDFEKKIHDNEFETYIERVKKSKPTPKGKDIDKFVDKLKSLYLGSAKSGLMRILAGKLFGSDALGGDREVAAITTKLEELKTRLEANDTAPDTDIIVTFSKLMKYAPEYASDLGTLAEKLQNLNLGYTTSRLMRSLANEIFGNGTDCDVDSVVSTLQKLMSSSSNENDECHIAFTALVEHDPRFGKTEHFPSLATKLRNMHMGSETVGLMQSFASKMVEEYLVTDSKVLEDIDTITQEIEALNQQYKSTLDSETGNLKSDSTSSNTVQQAFLALLTHKQDIDIPSLASLVHYHVLINEATFNHNFALLEKHIKQKFYKSGHLPDGCTVFVYSTNDDGSINNLSVWWSDVIGYTTHCRKRAPSYKKASNEQMKRLKDIGVTDNFTAIDAAIEEAKHDKARGKMGSAVASMKQSTVSLLDDLLPGGRVPFGGRGRGGRGRAVRGRGPPGHGRGGGGRMV